MERGREGPEGEREKGQERERGEPRDSEALGDEGPAFGDQVESVEEDC